MPWLRCPVCREPFDTTSSRAMPFCSERCRLIDLGRWLNEENGLPVVNSEEDNPAEDPGETP
jgi:uncharacterized protein